MSISLYASISVKDGRGKLITLNNRPNRIISLTPSNTEIIFAIGLGKYLIADTASCDYPEAAKKLTKVDGTTASVEKIAALHPDLIVAHSLLNHKQIDTLERLGYKVFAGDPHNFAELESFIDNLGKLTSAPNSQKTAKHIINIVSKVKSLSSRVFNRPRVLFSVGFEPLWAAGKSSYANELIKLAGGQNVAQSSSKFYQASVESVIVKDPEYILAFHSNPFIYKERSAWKITSAVKNNRIFSLNADIFTRIGPRLTNALIQLFKLLHPEQSAALRTSHLQ